MKFCMMFMKYNKTVIGFEYTMNLFGSGVSREPYKSLDLFFFLCLVNAVHAGYIAHHSLVRICLLSKPLLMPARFHRTSVNRLVNCCPVQQ